ncbi:MAG: BlaI/MecI/CopY family transcriptional regulator, partial [Planctomycetales bacterium]|nr:BlaI/MecI/CopY family transcriptional regulator [Planctomycetales bacterium]
MARPESEHPTELELEILKVLWDDSPLPVREVRARLESQSGRSLAHSSVITMLNIMHRKG